MLGRIIREPLPGEKKRSVELRDLKRELGLNLDEKSLVAELTRLLRAEGIEPVFSASNGKNTLKGYVLIAPKAPVSNRAASRSPNRSPDARSGMGATRPWTVPESAQFPATIDISAIQASNPAFLATVSEIDKRIASPVRPAGERAPTPTMPALPRIEMPQWHSDGPAEDDEGEEHDMRATAKDLVYIDAIKKLSQANKDLEARLATAEDLLGSRLCHILDEQKRMTDAMGAMRDSQARQNNLTIQTCFDFIRQSSEVFRQSVVAMFGELRTKCIRCAPKDTAAHRRTSRHTNAPHSPTLDVAQMLSQV